VTPDAVEKEFRGQGYGSFKEAVADAVVAFLTPARERYEKIRKDEEQLEAILAEGAAKARAISSETVALVRDRMGVGVPATGT
jgi:tryptophanyl-tRNA synthetase